jgi:hypothetical protein
MKSKKMQFALDSITVAAPFFLLDAKEGLGQRRMFDIEKRANFKVFLLAGSIKLTSPALVLIFF